MVSRGDYSLLLRGLAQPNRRITKRNRKEQGLVQEEVSREFDFAPSLFPYPSEPHTPPVLTCFLKREQF